MRFILSTVSAVALGLGLSASGFAAEPSPPNLAAKRAGVISQATPSPTEMLYVPITPCRAFGAQSIAATTARNFQITGSGSFVSQGGPAAGCGVPASAKAVTFNLTATNTSYPGYLTAYATGTPRPAITSLSLQNTNITTGAVSALGPAGTMTIYSSKTANVFGDVTGYWIPQLWAYVSSSGTLLDSSGRVVSSVNTNPGQYTVTFNRDINSCAGTASSDVTGHIVSVYTSGTLAYVYVVNNAGVYENYWFNLHIQC